MVNVVRSTNKNIKDFNLKEWAVADVEHYGREVDWKIKKYVFAAQENGEIVGTLKMKVQAGLVEIQTIIVSSGKRSKGIGKALMKQAEEIAKKSGAHKIYLITGKNWTARKFYESLGYKEVGELPKHYIKHDFVQFCKFL